MADPSAEGMLEAFYAELGAPAPQARILARQTLKRAAQLSAERHCSELEALRYLMELARAGRAGELPVRDRPGGGRAAAAEENDREP